MLAHWTFPMNSGCSAGGARLVRDEEAVSSNLTSPIRQGACRPSVNYSFDSSRIRGYRVLQCESIT